ncbi:MAG: ATP-binding protein [Verrucomicrobiota bacterium]
MDDSEKWQKRYQRERTARSEAERLLEEKSLALYRKTQELDELVGLQKELIAERTRDLKSALEEASLLSDAVSHAENGVIITGPDNRVIWANKAEAKISGYRPEELVGKVPGRVLQGADSDPAVRNYMRGKIINREAFEAEILNYHKNGHTYWIHLQATPVLDEKRKFKYYVAIQTDITEGRETRLRLEKEMQRANAMAERAKEANAAKTKFLATMSHELRTPLNGIIGYAQILEKNASITEKPSNQIRIIRQSGEHLLSLINDLLDMSRIEAGSHQLTPSRFDLKGMLKSTQEIISSKASEKGLQLKLLFDDGGHVPEGHRPRLFADSRALRQILINLLGNAIKFTDTGSISLEVQILGFNGEDARLLFAVVDTGRGIPEDKRDSLFDAFKQVDEARDVIQGSGLGLFIAQRLVQQMGDNIRVESTLREGSCFSFELDIPLDFERERNLPDIISKNAEHDSFPQSYNGNRKCLLIVDDVKDNRNFLKDLLQPIGFELDEAENGREALKKIKQRRYDLILSDIIMPFMSGYELIRLIRADPALKDNCVIAVSASLMQLSALEKDEMTNFDGFIAKPIQAEELLTILRQKLELEWIYSQTSDEETKVSRETPNTSGEDSDNLIERLHWLTRIGDVSAACAVLTGLKESEPELASKISPLLQNYKAQQAAEVLEKYLLFPRYNA